MSSMVDHWDSVIRPLLIALGARVVVEVGVARGLTARKLLEHAVQHDCVIHGIDLQPRPRLELPKLRARYGDRFVFHEAMSLEALQRIRDPDVVLIDGDHNWYSVYNELKTLSRVANEEGRPFPLTLLHDVDWPYGRRDMYYKPDTIPEEYRQEWARSGLLPGVPGLAGDAGLNGSIRNAVVEGTSRNGVRTALEDFVAETDVRIKFSSVPGFFGLGILADQALMDRRPELRSALEALRSPEFLEEQCRRLEQERIAGMVKCQEEMRKLMSREEAG